MISQKKAEKMQKMRKEKLKCTTYNKSIKN